jgi:hypothetical protein
VVTFTLGVPRADAATAAGAAPPKSVALDEVGAFLAIDANGNATVYSGKVDPGTGVYTGAHPDRGRRALSADGKGALRAGRHSAHAPSGHYLEPFVSFVSWLLRERAGGQNGRPILPASGLGVPVRFVAPDGGRADKIAL